LVSRAQSALQAMRWAEALDLASQALVADPTLDEAAGVVGIARHRLGVLEPPDAQLRQLTVAAVDMCGSTAIAAAVGPERYRRLMMDLYDVCAVSLARYDGRVVKYGGDGVLAQFGHPVAHEDDGRRAVLCALAILEEVARRGPQWRETYGSPVEVRIGIDTGIVAVGRVDGSPWAIEELAGDAPNVASRLQSMAEPMGLWITEATRRLTHGWFETEPLGAVELRNYPRPVRLHRVLRTSDADTRLEAGARRSRVLVDRVVEREMLRSAWERVIAGRTREVIGLTGPAGIGKSRLVEQFRATAAAGGATVVTIACSSLHRASPLRPVTRALRRYVSDALAHPAGGPDADGSLLDEIDRLLAEAPNRRVPATEASSIFSWLLGQAVGLDLQPETLRQWTFDALLDLSDAIAARAPMVLHVDDVDSADPSTAELLTLLLSRTPDTPQLVLLTGRTLPDHAVCDAVLELPGLPAPDAAVLARSVAPDMDADVVDRIVARCDGLPFYIEELTHSTAETGAEVIAGVVELSAFVAARLDELGAAPRRLVEQISIAGNEVRTDVLAQLSGGPTDRLEAHLADLAVRGVIRREDASSGGNVVRLRHDLIREAAYQGQLTDRRESRHLRLAGILSDLPPGAVPPDEVARHYTLGGDPASALPHWLAAGRAATAAGARREAIELFGNALAAIGRLPDDPALTGAELEAQLHLGAALSTIHGYTAPAARSAFERARELADALDDSTALFPALWGIWSYWFVLGELEEARLLVERCVVIGEQSGDDQRPRWVAAGMLGYQRLHLGDFTAARDELELACRHGGTEPMPEFPNHPGVISHSMLAVTYWFLGEHHDSTRLARRATELAAAMDPKDRRTALTQAWVACTLAWRAELAGDPEAAVELADTAIRIASEHGYATWLAAATLHRCIARCTLGHLDEALPQLDSAVGIWRSVGRHTDGSQRHPVLMTPYFAGQLARARQAAGDDAGAAALVAALLDATAASGERFWNPWLEALRDSLRETV
jgi:class 3 adenylate cyclase/tetratricopeptide (TPR) repeat protein